MASGGTGGGLDLWLVTVPNIYHKSRVLDFGALALQLPKVAYDLPGGAKRMVMRSKGIEMTLVNGEVTWEKGKLTGASAGKVLRS